jgi:hypothetical protein
MPTSQARVPEQLEPGQECEVKQWEPGPWEGLWLRATILSRSDDGQSLLLNYATTLGVANAQGWAPQACVRPLQPAIAPVGGPVLHPSVTSPLATSTPQDQATPTATEDELPNASIGGDPSSSLTETWQDHGSTWIGRRVRRSFGGIVSIGVITRWLSEGPEGASEAPALWHVCHADGDEEDLEAYEVEAALVEGVRVLEPSGDRTSPSPPLALAAQWKGRLLPGWAQLGCAVECLEENTPFTGALAIGELVQWLEAPPDTTGAIGEGTTEDLNTSSVSEPITHTQAFSAAGSAPSKQWAAKVDQRRLALEQIAHGLHPRPRGRPRQDKDGQTKVWCILTGRWVQQTEMCGELARRTNEAMAACQDAISRKA